MVLVILRTVSSQDINLWVLVVQYHKAMKHKREWLGLG